MNVGIAPTSKLPTLAVPARGGRGISFSEPALSAAEGAFLFLADWDEKLIWHPCDHALRAQRTLFNSRYCIRNSVYVLGNMASQYFPVLLNSSIASACLRKNSSGNVNTIPRSMALSWRRIDHRSASGVSVCPAEGIGRSCATAPNPIDYMQIVRYNRLTP